MLKMKNKAFTLIETLIAITLTTVVITAVTGLILSTLMANTRNMRTLQATFLAQEGLEAVRFMRDSNWLQNYSWDSASFLWGQDFHVDATNPELTLYLVPELCSTDSGQGPCFSLSTFEEDGVVTLEDTAEFGRSLTFTALPDETDPSQMQDDKMQVMCTVTWDERGNERSVSLSTYLSNWQ